MVSYFKTIRLANVKIMTISSVEGIWGNGNFHILLMIANSKIEIVQKMNATMPQLIKTCISYKGANSIRMLTSALKISVCLIRTSVWHLCLE